MLSRIYGLGLRTDNHSLGYLILKMRFVCLDTNVTRFISSELGESTVLKKKALDIHEFDSRIETKSILKAKDGCPT